MLLQHPRYLRKGSKECVVVSLLYPVGLSDEVFEVHANRTKQAQTLEL